MAYVEINSFWGWIKALAWTMCAIVVFLFLLVGWSLYMFFWLIGYYANEIMMKLKMAS